MPPKKSQAKHNQKIDSKAHKLEKESQEEEVKAGEEEKDITINTSTKFDEDDESDDDQELIDQINDDEECSEVDDEKLYDLLKCETHDFELTFTDIKNDQTLKREPLSKYSIDLIKKVITNARLKKKREKKDLKEWQKNHQSNQVLQKRTQAHRKVDTIEKSIYKRQEVSTSPSDCEPSYFQARFLINHFDLYSEVIKKEILKTLNDYITRNTDLMNQTQSLMVFNLSQVAKDSYQKGDMNALKNLLRSTTPIISILINIQISLVNTNYMEEGSTLSYTLLPFLNQVNDYGFLPEASQYIMQKFTKTLIDHAIDTQCEVGKGFIICSLKFESSKLHKIIGFKQNKEQLKQALIERKFSPKISNYISKHYQSLLWPELLNILNGKTEMVVMDLLEILQKMNIISDPGSLVQSLLQIQAQRQLIIDCLLKVERIDIGLQVLIRVLDSLIKQPKEAIIEILAQDSKQWDSLSIKEENKGDSLEATEDKSYMDEVYTAMTKQATQIVSRETLNNISQSISEEIEAYKHCEYQSTVAAVIASHDDPLIIAVSPTGSGKTWIQGLISKYYCLQDKLVTIIEPNEALKQQTIEKLAQVDYHITVITIDEFYQFGTDDEVLIVDEYDMIIQESPYAIRDNCIMGIWGLRDKKVIAFSATSSMIIEKFMFNCIGKVKVLKFKAQYELLNQITPIQEPIIVNCKDEKDLMNKAMAQVEKVYDTKPVIVIYDREQEEPLEHLIKENRYQFFKGVQEQVLNEIRGYDTGILMIEGKDCRGIDTRFKVDSQVIILSEVKSYHQLQQMIGRSSRTRGICESYMFIQSQEKGSLLLSRLQRQGISDIEELLRLVKLFERKNNDIGLLNTLRKKQNQNTLIGSLKQLQEKMVAKDFASLIKEK